MKALLQEKWTGFGDSCGSEGECYDVFNSGVPLRLLGQPVLSELSHFYSSLLIFAAPPPIALI